MTTKDVLEKWFACRASGDVSGARALWAADHHLCCLLTGAMRAPAFGFEAVSHRMSVLMARETSHVQADYDLIEKPLGGAINLVIIPKLAMHTRYADEPAAPVSMRRVRALALVQATAEGHSLVQWTEGPPAPLVALLGHAAAVAKAGHPPIDAGYEQ